MSTLALLIRGIGKEGMIYIKGCQNPCLFYVTQTMSFLPSKSYTNRLYRFRWPASSSMGPKPLLFLTSKPAAFEIAELKGADLCPVLNYHQ
jgi:hypothetical protein